jgi:transcriptional regulator GlxA family with amidase domain
MSYREHVGLPALVPWLACTWERRDDGRSPVRVLPDGCVDIVWTELVREAVARLREPQVAVAGLAAGLGVSERQLRRRVSAAVGYGPKRLSRVLRLHRALDAARAGDDFARVAFAAGYADQAHFANDCRALAGVTPSVMLSA